MRSVFLHRPWHDSTQYITRLAAHAHLNGGSMPTTIIVCFSRAKDSTDALHVPKECGRTDDKSMRRDQ